MGAALLATATVAGGLLVAIIIELIGADRHEAWYRAHSSSTQLLAVVIISLVTGVAAAIGFRAATSSLQQTKPAGVLAGVVGGFAVLLFLILTGREYTGNAWLPFFGLAAIVAGAAFYLARLDRGTR